MDWEPQGARKKAFIFYLCTGTGLGAARSSTKAYNILPDRHNILPDRDILPGVPGVTGGAGVPGVTGVTGGAGVPGVTGGAGVPGVTGGAGVPEVTGGLLYFARSDTQRHKG